MLDPVQNHALRLCLGAYRTSPSSSLCMLANESLLYVRRQKLSIQHCLKLSTSSHNPAYNSVFNCKFKRSFELKPNQIPALGIRFQPELQAVGFKKKDVLHCSVPSKPPWLLKRPQIDFSMHASCKESTPPEIFRAKYYEICDQYQDYFIQMDLLVVIK